MKKWFIDFETRSSISLNQYGGRIYADNPNTEILISCLIDEHDNVHLWVPIVKPNAPILTKLNYSNISVGPEIPSIYNDINPKDELIGHNIIGFDRFIYQKFIKKHINYIDTMYMTRSYNVGGGLDNASKFFGLPEKDERAVAIRDRISKLRAIGGRLIKIQPNAEELVRLIDYCIQDTKNCKFIYNKLLPLYEHELSYVDMKINDLGFSIDKSGLNQLIKIYREIINVARTTLVEESDFNIKKAGSVKQIKVFLQSLGIILPDLDQRTIARFMDDPWAFATGLTSEDEIEVAVNILSARKESLTNALRRLETIQHILLFTNRIKDCFQKNKAHTGRWSAKGVQPHNFPRGGAINQNIIVKALNENTLNIDLITKEAEKAKEPRTTSLRGFLKYVLIPEDGYDFAIADYNAIEARGVAWLSDCKKMLENFSNPNKDIYVETANGLGLEGKIKSNRFIGKTIILGCGYGLGVNGFEDKCKTIWNIDLNKLKLTGKECVNYGYRRQYFEVPAMWNELQDKSVWAVENPGTFVQACNGKVRFGSDGKILEVQLPSKRCLYYHDIQVDRDIFGENFVVKYVTELGLVKDLYGGFLTENIVQAFCRDLLANSLIKLYKLKYRIPLHIHDEIVVERLKSIIVESLHKLCETMSTPPDWATNFPIRVEGFTASRYSKLAFDDSIKAEYLLGRSLAI